ncbi:DEAD/DEAH box helicase [Shouchella lonarensis]|uniref:Competence protein ComFA n=1 Tax=Shouchella lonarensis TaxID=1464122 RepID=A0A1G6H255_9BACI|nr:DEAD/DEAH box helicase family protein [Shouchella lonarensis]SDB87995.1 competence protein ComFA [Shouchella lonarensis]
MTNQAIRQCLAGRQLLETEVPFPKEVLHRSLHVNHQPALQSEFGHWHCRRCGNDEQALFYTHECARCKQQCTYCRYCIRLGKASSCTLLYTWVGALFSYRPLFSACAWRGTLTSAQAVAAKALVRAVEQAHVHLLWAVCGAGKTEVLYPALARSFALGYRVAIVAPRIDVIKELAPRLYEAFPKVSQSVWYAGSRKQPLHAQLVLATTHQLMRYQHAFDVVIVDEVDAFPYAYDERLQRAVERARKNVSAFILLSATPSRQIQKQYRFHQTKISRRFHGHDLPLPSLQWCGHWRKDLQQGKLPKKVRAWMMSHRIKPKMIFVPSVHILEQLSISLKRADMAHVAVHAQSQARHTDVALYRRGEVDCIVTTTILERGITIKGLQVAVLGAEDHIFTEAALVQISGRVGRNQAEPTGDIVFFHHGKTKAMKKAIAHIVSMNEEE